MIDYITCYLERFLIILTTLGTVAVLWLMVLALFHRQEGRNRFWNVVCALTAADVILLSLVLL